MGVLGVKKFADQCYRAQKYCSVPEVNILFIIPIEILILAITKNRTNRLSSDDICFYSIVRSIYHIIFDFLNIFFYNLCSVYTVNNPQERSTKSEKSLLLEATPTLLSWSIVIDIIESVSRTTYIFVYAMFILLSMVTTKKKDKVIEEIVSST